MALIDDLRTATLTARSSLSQEASDAKADVLTRVNATLTAAAEAGSYSAQVPVDVAFPNAEPEDMATNIALLVEILQSERLTVSPIGNEVTVSWS